MNGPAFPRNIELRVYQHAVVDRIAAQVDAGKRRVLLVAPTGSGKTIVAAKIVSDAVTTGARVLFLVHRRELIHQSSRKLHDAGVDHGIVAANFPARPGEPVQVASIQTLHARAVRSRVLSLPAAEVVVIDEAHHATADSWRRILAAYPSAVIIGLTATPARGDGRGLGGLFETLVECPNIAELIAAGYLVPTKVYAPSRPDLDGVAVRHGDYVERQLAERMDRPCLVGDIVEHWHKLAGRRRTAVFATSIGHAVHLRDEFLRSGAVAEHIDGTTPAAERDAILARLASGATEVVTNCGVLTEGWDLPEIGCIVLARPTRSFTLYRQVVGRGLRPAPGKDHCLILDHSGATLDHGLIEEPVKWVLAPDKHALRESQWAGGAGSDRVLTTCPECHAVRWQGRPCPACGWRPPPKPKAVEVEQGDLARLDQARRAHPPTYTDADRRRFLGEVEWIRRERGYNPGWTAHQYRKKFDAWPPRGNVEACAPSEATRAWIRSRQIAYRAAMRKAGVPWRR
jgi:DNA repair protein RadD